MRARTLILAVAALASAAPVLRAQAKATFDRRKYPLFKHSEGEFFLALDGGRPSGRIVAFRLQFVFFHLQRPHPVVAVHEHRAGGLGRIRTGTGAEQQRAGEAGADEFVMKGASYESLVNAILAGSGLGRPLGPPS